MAIDVLIVDDEKDIQMLIAEGLSDEYTCRMAMNSEETFAQINKKVPGVIILDIWLQGSTLDGLGILEIVKSRYPNLPVIVISGHGTIQTAVSAIKKGAYDYVEKPFTHDKLAIVLNRACEASKLKIDNMSLRSKVAEPDQLIGDSSVMTKLRQEIDRVASTNSRVMLHGGIGSGKELAARLMHKQSKVADGPFMHFTPTGLSTDQVLASLFGDDRVESLSSARRSSILELANGGTLYLDKVEDLPQAAQSKLLRILQNAVIEGTGINGTVKLDVRIISSTTTNLESLITEGKFREDLYYRLNIVPIRIPTLAERREDIPLLIDFLVQQSHKIFGTRITTFAPETIALLQVYNWPGNILQLKNVIEWALIMSSGNNLPIKPEMLPNDITNNNNLPEILSSGDMSLSLREARRRFEEKYLKWHMQRLGDNISKTSKAIGMERSALHRKIKGLSIPPYRSSRSEHIDDKHSNAAS